MIDSSQPILEVRKRRHGHHGTETYLEWPVLTHGTVQVDTLDVFLQSMHRKDVVPLGRGVLYTITISIQRRAASNKLKLNIQKLHIPQQEQLPYPESPPKPSRKPSIQHQQQAPKHYPD